MLLEEFPFEPGFRLTDGDLLNKVAAEPAYSVDNSVTATGTTQSTAYNIRATVTNITAGGDQTGVRLPFPKVGRILYLMNYTATPKKIYPYDMELINNAPTADLPFAMAAILVCTGPASWMAAMVGADTITGDIILDAADANTPTSDGHFVNISGGAGGTTSGNGGAVAITSGPATGNPGDGGNINIIAGDSINGIGGTVRIEGGNPGGLVTIQSADVWPANAAFTAKNSGSVDFITGQTKDGASGAITFGTGTALGNGNTGDITFGTGDADVVGTSGHSGNIDISTGSANGAVTGNIFISTGAVTGTQAAGDVTLQGGVSSGGKGGDIAIAAGTGTPGGVVTITSPTSVTITAPNTSFPGAAVSLNHKLNFAAGGANSINALGPSDTLTIQTASATGAAKAGNIFISGGTSQTGDSGGINLTGGTTGGGVPGNIFLQAGISGSTKQGGETDVYAGDNAGGGPGGDLFLSAGSALVSGVGGNVHLSAGSGTPSGLIFVDSAAKFNDKVGFSGVTPIARQTVTGSRGGNAALASFLTAMAATGLITDGSTA